MKQQNLLGQVQLASIVFLIASSVVLSGCAGPARESTGEPVGAPVDSPNPTDPNEVPIPDDAPPIGSAPTDATLPDDVETSVLQDIATTGNVPAGDLQIMAAQPQAWPDGCLGLGGPDEICTFAVVDGWEVIVSDGESQWVYRTDSDGTIARLAQDPERALK